VDIIILSKLQKQHKYSKKEDGTVDSKGQYMGHSNKMCAVLLVFS